VYRLSSDTALVQTVDYITPVVDDPYTFGAVAAANALSDIYAMGARPVTALNLVGFPVKTLPLSWLEAILRGGADKVMEAGASLVGGHSIDDYEPKYGLSVTGLVHPERIIRKKGALPGDLLVLTKPLGIGIITTGIDRELVRPGTIEQVVQVMLKLNQDASLAMLQVGVHAATDITGFGLLGHLRELLLASDTGAKVSLEKVPVLPDAWELARQGVIPEGSHNNYSFLVDSVAWEANIPMEAQIILCDAQTSGGLLIAVPPEKADTLMNELTSRGVMSATIIGEIVPERIGAIQVSN
jgi:selenide, water dikinase